jgi:hypothetical protein
MEYSVKSMMIGRKPRGEDMFKTAFIKFFDSSDPLSPEVMPKEEKDYRNVREIVLSGFEIRYLLEGNDLLLLNVGKIKVDEDKKNNILKITRC